MVLEYMGIWWLGFETHDCTYGGKRAMIDSDYAVLKAKFGQTASCYLNLVCKVGQMWRQKMCYVSHIGMDWFGNSAGVIWDCGRDNVGAYWNGVVSGHVLGCMEMRWLIR